MSLRKVIRRVGVALATTALVAVPIAVATSSPASASTIPYGNLQFCAQGSFPAYVHVLAEPTGWGGRSPETISAIVRPGQCWMYSVSTAGVWAQVDIGVLGRQQLVQQQCLGDRPGCRGLGVEPLVLAVVAQ